MDQQNNFLKNSDTTTMKLNEETMDTENGNMETNTTQTTTENAEDWNEMLDLSVVFTPAEEKLLLEACELDGSGESLSEHPELSAEEKKNKRAAKRARHKANKNKNRNLSAATPSQNQPARDGAKPEKVESFNSGLNRPVIPPVKAGSSDQKTAPKMPSSGKKNNLRPGSGAKSSPMDANGGSGSEAVRKGGNSGSNVKRKRTNTTTPPLQPAKKKEAKQTVGRQLYSEAARLDLTVLIRREGSGFDQAALDELVSLLCSELDKFQQGAVRPTFESHQLSNGSASFVCANELSRDWLLSIPGTIGSLNGNKLWATTAKAEQTRPRIILSVPISGRDAPPTNELIFERLRSSNPGLSTDAWLHLRNFRDEPKARTLLILVDQSTVDFIRTRNRKLYYQVYNLTVEIRGGRSDTNPRNGS